MAEAICITTDEEIDAALERARHVPDLPGAVSAEYHKGLDVIELQLEGGRRLLLPRMEIQGLEAASKEQLSQIDIYAGVDIAWPLLDVDHYLPSLIAGQYGSTKWMRRLERLGVRDTPNNNGHAVASLKASYALYPLMEPFSHVEGKTLLGVVETHQDERLSDLNFIFRSGSFHVQCNAKASSIQVAFDPTQQSQAAGTPSEPWKTFVGANARLSWLATNQHGYVDTVLLSFGDELSPQVAITSVGPNLRVTRFHE